MSQNYKNTSNHNSFTHQQFEDVLIKEEPIETNITGNIQNVLSQESDSHPDTPHINHLKKTMTDAAAPIIKGDKPKKPAQKPIPYADMITAAIKGLHERGGSSRKAIRKYMLDNYNFPYEDRKMQNRTLLAIRKMLAAKKLVQVKASFKLNPEMLATKKLVQVKGTSQIPSKVERLGKEVERLVKKLEAMRAAHEKEEKELEAQINNLLKEKRQNENKNLRVQSSVQKKKQPKKSQQGRNSLKKLTKDDNQEEDMGIYKGLDDDEYDSCPSSSMSVYSNVSIKEETIETNINCNIQGVLSGESDSHPGMLVRSDVSVKEEPVETKSIRKIQGMFSQGASVKLQPTFGHIKEEINSEKMQPDSNSFSLELSQTKNSNSSNEMHTVENNMDIFAEEGNLKTLRTTDTIRNSPVDRMVEVDVDNTGIYVPEGWQRKVYRNTYSDGNIRFHVFYYNPEGKRFWNKVMVNSQLALLSNSKYSKSINVEKMDFTKPIEMDKMLMSQNYKK